MSKPDKLEQIRMNHEERSGITGNYNPHMDYIKEAVQMYNEMNYLLTLIDVVEELANVQIRQASRNRKTKRIAVAPRGTGSRKKKTQKG